MCERSPPKRTTSRSMRPPSTTIRIERSTPAPRKRRDRTLGAGDWDVERAGGAVLNAAIIVLAMNLPDRPGHGGLHRTERGRLFEGTHLVDRAQEPEASPHHRQPPFAKHL